MSPGFSPSLARYLDIQESLDSFKPVIPPEKLQNAHFSPVINSL
jgi:hypothetical protein